jgi:hypothetical protein
VVLVIRPEDVLKAYEQTQFRPLFGSWEERLTGGYHAACALITLAEALGKSVDDVREREGRDYVAGFVCGWDAEVIGGRMRFDVSEHWRNGFLDGRKAANAVLSSRAWRQVEWEENGGKVVMLSEK